MLEVYKSLFEKEIITKEMKDFFNKRTFNHIRLTAKYLRKILKSSIVNELDREILIYEIVNHDKSKFIEPEYKSYVILTWDYRCKDRGISYDLPEDVKERVHQATHHHVKNNKHHPDYWSDQDIDLINREDRDEPNGSEIIDASRMPDEYIACMCADWAAMSLEKGTNTPQEWAKKNINVRWKFNEDQEELIYKILDEIWK